jgi:hypothetical protein
MTTSGGSGNLKLEFEHWPVVWLWPIALVLMQLTLVAIGDFSLTVAVIACHLLQLHLVMLYWLNRPPNWQVMTALVILAYGLISGLFARDPVEFGRSFAHVANLVLMALICLNIRIGQGHEIPRSLAVFCLAASAAALVIIAQAASFNLLRDFRLSALLGDFAPLGPGGEVYAPSPNAALPRANGFYSEPSVAGWFMSFALAVALAARPLRPILGALTAGLCSFAAMATLSLTGILGSALVWSGYLLLVRDPGWFKAIAGLIATLGIGAALHQVHELGILSRFAHLETPGTSIYFRLTAPYQLIGESLERFPFGYPLGQTDFIASRHYYINWEQGSQTNIDNTLLMVVFYFGLLGIAFNAAYLLKAAQYLVARRHVVGLFMLSFLIALCTTGAGWAHHVVLMIGYAIVVGRFLQGQRLLRLPRLRIVWRPPLTPLRSAAPPARARLQGARSLAALPP